MADKKTFHLNAEKATELCKQIFIGAGVPEQDALTVAQNLVMADLRGVSSHGVSRMFVYCQRIVDGMTNLNPNVKIISEAPAALHLDGDNGLGAIVGKKAMQMTINKAKTSGIACASVKHCNHFGIAGFYSMMALKYDMIGLAITNAPPTMAPWGSISPIIGTNPYAFAIPAGKHRPMVMDTATSVVARGKINLAEIENKPIPEGWAMDKEGRMTTNATEALAGCVLPFGTYKGSGTSIVIDILSSVLSGASFGQHVGSLYKNSETHQDLGYFFTAINISFFENPDVFKSRIDQMIDEIKSSTKAYGVDEIFVPGEIEFNNEKQNLKSGIAIGPGVLADLNKLAERYNIKLNPNDCIVG